MNHSIYDRNNHTIERKRANAISESDCVLVSDYERTTK